MAQLCAPQSDNTMTSRRIYDEIYGSFVVVIKSHQADFRNKVWPLCHNLIMSKIHQVLFTLCGILAVLLGLLGIILPGLPTTPFILLAAACFAKGSTRLHQRLLANKYLGAMIRDWEQNRSLSRRIKWSAIGLMLVMTSLSIWQFSGKPLLQLLLVVVAVIGAIVVGRIPTRSH